MLHLIYLSDATETCGRLARAGHSPAYHEPSETPASVAQVWPMGDCYITDLGAQVWPWVMYSGAPGEGEPMGYYLEDVPPLPKPPAITPDMIVERDTGIPTPAEVAQIPIERRALFAAQCLQRTGVGFNRHDAAKLFGISTIEINRCIRAIHPKAHKRPQSRSAQAAHWYYKTEDASRQDAANKFGVSLGAVHTALHALYHPDLIPSGRKGLGVEATKKRNIPASAARWAWKEGQTVKCAAQRYGVPVDEVLREYYKIEAAWHRKHGRHM